MRNHVKTTRQILSEVGESTDPIEIANIIKQKLEAGGLSDVRGWMCDNGVDIGGKTVMRIVSIQF